MTATLPRFRSRNPLGVTRATTIIGLVLSPALIKIYCDLSTRAETINEYQTGRSAILSKIETALDSHDRETLLRLHGKFAGCVPDSKFKATLNNALATVTAREAELELAVSKHLDLNRHREDLAARQGQEKAQPRSGNVGQQELSMLPR